MTAIHCLNSVSYSFANASDWSGGSVSGASDGAILDAARTKLNTVTTSADETVKSVQTAATATLSIADGTFSAASGTEMGANAGTIELAGFATLQVGGAFDNSGAVILDGVFSFSRLSADTAFSGGGPPMLLSMRNHPELR